MADRRSPGLTFGQLITLTFGFLLASVVIFVFGLWVGRDLAEQQATKQREVAHVPVVPPPPEPTRAAVVAVPTHAAPAVAVATHAPVVLAVAPTNTPLPVLTPTPVMVVRAGATATRVQPAAAPTGGTGGFTVQAYATNDMMRAVMLSRTLQTKGYSASTATKQVGGVTWYLVRVGRYRDHAAAKAMESKLRSEEGLEAASVTAQ
jgi:septal ring-binding cell division protein DamX